MTARTRQDQVDTSPLDALMAAFFDAVSFTEDAAPHYESVLTLFLPGALLVRCGPGEPVAVTVEQFVTQRQAALRAGGLTSFQELETDAECDLFRGVAHRFGAYTKNGTLDGTAFAATGWISTQFTRQPDGWKISAMAWDDEP